MAANDFAELQVQLAEFARERDWEQFHSPKNLAMALIVEAGELVEHFQWLSQSQSRQLDSSRQQAVAEELADVMIYTLRLAGVLGIDMRQAVQQKIKKNAEKYPAEKVQGSARKYSEY